MGSLEITTLDIAKFFYKRNITIKKRTDILFDLWDRRFKYLEYYMYDNFRLFSNEVNNLLADICFDNIIFEEIDEIILIQNDIKSDYCNQRLYKLNESRTEDFLKQCKLRLLYDSNRDYINMKMRTILKACGYKRRSKKIIKELRNGLSKLKLYMNDGYTNIDFSQDTDYRKIKNIKMDEYIRFYSYF